MEITDRQQLADWLDHLCEQITVIAPCADEDVLLYRPIESSREVVFDLQRTVMSPKTWLWPSTEALFRIHRQGQAAQVEDLPPEAEQVLFAVRPCDARAFAVLDALLSEHQPADAYYSARRQHTTLVGLACPHLWPDCFCTSVGGAPDDSTGMDVMLYADGDSYLVEAVTEKGERLLAGNPGGAALAAESTPRQPPTAAAPGQTVPVLPPAAWPSLFADAIWARLSERCLSCHACTYVCPTCRCFDVRDYVTALGAGGSDIERLRSWDSCMASAYRRIAGGHNPRPSKMHRLRNRYYCKFDYCPEAFGVVACVGCGRCIAVCPVGVDITEMLQEIAALPAAVAAEGDAHE